METTHRRSSFEICLAILKCCQKPRLANHIVYENNLSYRTYRKEINSLIANKLIEEIPVVGDTRTRVKFQTSELGLAFLSKFAEYLHIFGLDQTSVSSGETGHQPHDQVNQLNKENC